MAEKVGKKNIAYYFGMLCGILAVIMCLVTIGMSVVDKFYSIYLLSVALILLGFNRIGLHLSNFKENMFENIFLTAFIFGLAILASLTKYSIYCLITSMCCYSLTIIGYCLLKIREEKTIQQIIFRSLCITLAFLFSFVFFFPEIYAKHASSVSNSNFIVLCYSLMILVSSGKNLLFPYHKTLKLNVVSNIIKKSMVNEIILSLLILVVICSVYFTVVEPNIVSYVDALWYSFSVITTIGFGDVVITTTLGRILSVLLGIFGIAVVAVFTSFIVNFYNEMNRRREDKTIEKLLDETKKLEKIEEQNPENK